LEGIMVKRVAADTPVSIPRITTFFFQSCQVGAVGFLAPFQNVTPSLAPGVVAVGMDFGEPDGLSGAVDVAEAPLDAAPVPRQVVVHHEVRTLKVDSLARRVGCNQHLDSGIM
jgi:hypothetical protein